ncbi:hypothetical protein [Xylophilus ampelinus]|uniref:Uncharacterized protein n=1 Tax=Xylophilus ampelinus TaxID=54067 RepID=A0A318SK13_9BURK|nr:hypothetical protein [Xylophilus ampelinus]MCS4511135.1 hypothetical protein [Xylophilus ampelinus]PYE75113.1 hypothetical protein DFQ15_12066 [Xylophilus ampelinus]
MAAQLQEFRFDQNPWRLDYLGGLQDATSRQSEPQIQVFLSELDRRGGDPLMNPSLAEPRRHAVAHIKVGQLSLLKLGSVWRDGVEIPPDITPRQETFELDPAAFELMRFNSKVLVGGQWYPLMASRRYRVSSEAAQALANSWLAVAYAPTTGYELVAVPSTVIFQKCMATSPKAVRRLVFGEIDKIVDPSSGFIDDEDSKFYVELFKDFRDGEAKAIANLKAAEAGRREYTRMRNELVRERADQHAGSRQSSLPQLKLGFPFDNPIKFVALGKRLPFHNQSDEDAPLKWGFLVTQILELTTRLPFDNLVIGRKNNAKKGKNSNDPDLPQAWPGLSKVEPDFPEPDQPVDSGDDPSIELEKWALEAAGDFTAVGLTRIDEPKEVQQYSGMSRTNADGVQASGTGTTGLAGSNAAGVVEVDLHPEETPKIPITLGEFFDAIDILREQGHAAETIAIAQRYRRSETGPGIVNFLPRAIRGNRSWHLVSDLPGASPRAYVVARLYIGQSWHYFIELERKGADAYAVQHVRAHSGEAIVGEHLEGFMVDVAASNGWAAKAHYKHWIFKKINHPKKDRAAALARALLKSV